MRQSSLGNVNGYGIISNKNSPFCSGPFSVLTSIHPKRRTHRSTFGDDGASEGDEEAAATGAGAESEPSAAEFAKAAKEDAADEADDVTRRDRRWIHEYDLGDEGTLDDGVPAAEEEEVLDRRRAFIAPPRPPPTAIDYRTEYPELPSPPRLLPSLGRRASPSTPPAAGVGGTCGGGCERGRGAPCGDGGFGSPPLWRQGS